MTRMSLVAALLAASLTTAAGAQPATPAPGPRNFDARIGLNTAVSEAPGTAQMNALDAMRSRMHGLTVRFDRTTGATRALSNPMGYLTGPAPGAKPRQLALNFVEENPDLLGLDAADVAACEVTDVVPSQVTGATHVYLQQSYQGIPVYNGQLQVHVNRQGRILGISNDFLPGLAGAMGQARATRSAAQAVAAAARDLGIALPGRRLPAVLSETDDARRTTHLDAAGLSLEPITARLAILPIRRGNARLVWNFQIATLDGEHWYDINVDAVNGKLWTRFDWTSDAAYRVYPLPAESPDHLTPAPPSDGRLLVSDPHLAAPNASPLGWHDTGTTSFTIPRGNNVHAYEDRDANNAPPATQPSCGTSLTCDFPINLSGDPSTYISAAVTNLFYWNNIIHDVQYQYGFDEVGGNFQVNTFGRGGAGNDDVRAEAQDGSGTCNANFSTPTDGNRPRMQMFICTRSTPSHDGDLDSGVVIHEYSHGISTRQVGGPGNSSCLSNAQEAGEGWSDWIALVYTAEVGDTGPDARGIGNYLFGQAPDAGGIRALPYSTDPAVNDWTYATISSMPEVHGLGSVWAEILWRAYWALVDQHGFDPDLYNAAGGAGNQRAMLYVNEGFKNTACSPTFLDNRDGILQAAMDNFGGEDVCTLWKSFAASGLGTDASTPGSNSTSATNGFSVPPECQGNTPPTVTITAPASGSVFDAGTSVSFAGTASDFQDGNLSANLVWTSNLDGQIGTGASFSTSTLSIGTHTVTATVTDSGGLTGQASITVTINQPGTGPQVLLSASFDADTDGFVYQDDTFRGTAQPTYESGARTATGGFSGGGLQVTLGGIDNADILGMSGGWSHSFTVTTRSNVTVEARFNLTQTSEYESDEFSEALLQAAGQLFVAATIAGDGNGGLPRTTGFQLFSADLGALDPGTYTLTVGGFNNKKTLNDESTTVVVDDVRVEATPAPACTVLHAADFESGAAGWAFNAGASTCTTGSWVVGNPDGVVNGGVVTQLEDDHTPAPGVNAFFTQPNTGGAGTDDVDGGVCTGVSPIVDATGFTTVEVSLWYYHGQRDAGDDPTGDFFRIDLSTNGGVSFPINLVSIGDVTSNAAWTQVKTTLTNPGPIQIRVQASDGPVAGDLVEAGIDDVVICTTDPVP